MGTDNSVAKDRVVIVTTDFWDDKQLNPPKIFINPSLHPIPFWNIENIPAWYDQQKRTYLLKYLLQKQNTDFGNFLIEQQELQKIINRRTTYGESFPEELTNVIKTINNSLWKNNSVNLHLFPSNLQFKKLENLEIYALPVLPTEAMGQIDDYIGFLIRAWEKTFNAAEERNISTFYIILHGKDLNPLYNYGEMVLDVPTHDTSNYYKKAIIGADILKLGQQYKVILFMHHAQKCPRILSGFLRNNDVGELIEEIDKIYTFLSLPWKKFYDLINTLSMKIIVGTPIDNDLSELNGDDYKAIVDEMRKLDKEALHLILNANNKSIPTEIKSAFNRIISHGNITSIF